MIHLAYTAATVYSLSTYDPKTLLKDYQAHSKTIGLC